MPSRLKLREKLRLRPSSHDAAIVSGLSTILSVQTVATTTAAPSTTITAPLATTAASSTRTAAAISRYIFYWFFSSIFLKQANTLLLSRNFAFTDALQQHLAKLSPDENFTFHTSHQTLTAESILAKVRDYDRDWNHKSGSRNCAEQVEKSFRILNSSSEVLQ